MQLGFSPGARSPAGRPGGRSPSASPVLSFQQPKRDSVAQPKPLAASYHEPEVVKAEDYEGLIHEEFRQAAKLYPDQVAVEGQARQYTYRELDQITDDLAAFLRVQYGAFPESKVAIYMERCEEYVIAILACFKAGAAYCPFELAYPSSLLQAVIAEVQPCVVLTKQRHAEQGLPPDLNTFNLDEGFELNVEAARPDASVLLEQPCTPDSLGYVIYSGGSTGRPKGIEAPHRSPLASYLWRFSISGYLPGARVGCNVFFVWECLRPLLRGGACIIIPDDIIFDAVALGKYLEVKQCTEVLFTPSLLSTLLAATDVSFLQSLPLQVVWLNGEVVTKLLVAEFRRILPHVRLFNTYSISECGEVCAMDLTSVPLDSVEKFFPVGEAALGGPVEAIKFIDAETANFQDEVQKGSPGELWICGRGIGLGYTNNEKQTKERFPTIDGKRWYRTGDLAKELPNGMLEILGRCDFMVKVRGYSIVLGAVEAAIEKLVGVGSCVVVAIGEEGEDKRLVAYMTACKAGSLRGRLNLGQQQIDQFGRCPAIVQELLAELPHYAAPSTFVLLDEMPLVGASQKTDRKALPAPPAPPQKAELPAGFDFEGTVPHCRLLFEIVLGLEEGAIEQESNFFEFGGHSLKATELLTLVKKHKTEELKVPSIADFLKAPTPLGLSSALGMSPRGRARTASWNEKKTTYLPKEVEKFQFDRSIPNLQTQAFWRYIVFTGAASRVLLTGATGYVGAFLLRALLDSGVTTVFCLARVSKSSKEPEKDGKMRIKENCEKHGIQSIDWNRVRCLPGDISMEHLGLSEEEYAFLTQFVDVVVHAAAYVNLVLPYDLMVHGNVRGTAQVIDFARRGKVKALHYVSTNGIFPEQGEPRSFSETDVPPHRELVSGYGQTKWVAEQLVLQAHQRGLPGAVYRLGNVAGPHGERSWNESDANLLFLRACLERSSVPDAPWAVEMTPVDFVADFITSCVQNLDFANHKLFHLINPTKLSLETVQSCAQSLGYSMTRQAVGAWCGQVDDADAASLVLTQESLEQLLGRLHSYTHENTMEGCAKFGLKYPCLDAAYFSTTVRRLAAENLLPMPPQLGGRLAGKVAVITGASSGIGLGIAQALAREGARVVLVSRSEQKLKAAASLVQGATPIACDVSKRRDVEQMMQQVEDKFHRVDILVNCAGVMYFTLMKNLHFDEWEQTIDINCKGVVNCCGAALPRMITAKQGHMINISSDAARTVFPALSVYNASKAFVNVFSKGLRCELVGTGIRVTDIQPGDTRTNLVMQNSDKEAAQKVGVAINQVIGEGVAAEAASYLDPEDIAQAVLYAVTAPSHVGVHEILIEPRDQMFGDPTAMG